MTLLSGKLARRRPIGGGKSDVDRAAFDLAETDLVAFFLQRAGDEIHRRTAEKTGHE